MTTAELAQSDTNRMTTLGMQDNLASLMLLADKLYRRSPTEWRKANVTREAALAKLKNAIDINTPWPDLQGKRDIAALSLLLSDEINERERNLSFEREFGKIIGSLDLLSSVLTEKYRRAVITYVQNLLGGTFLQFLLVR